MRPYHFDTDWTAERPAITKDSGGAPVETLTTVGTYRGKYDIVGANYSAQNGSLSEDTDAIIYSNDCDVETGDVITARDIRHRALSVDRTTLRGRIGHIEIYLAQEDD